MTHNDYLRLAAETGILGLSAYLLLMGCLLGTTWKDFRRTKSERVRGLQMGLMALIVGFMVRQAADNTLRNIVGMIYFWLIVALIRNMSRWALLNPDFDIRPVITENGARDENKPFPDSERII
jgi:putative inorganic carbon (HCO3(-)) transporter